MRNPVHRRALLAAPALLALPAIAQTAWPDRPVRVIVPFAPGGPTDQLARQAARDLSSRLGQPFVVENRPGAGANIGIGQAARATPDGTTLLFVSAAIAINPSLYAQVPYDLARDLIPVTRVATSFNIIASRPDRPFQDIAGLVTAARARPGALTYSSPGIGTSPHLAMEMLKQRANIDILHVPFNGAAPAVQAALGGQVDMVSSSLPVAQAHVAAGTLRGLAVTGPVAIGGVPSLVEQGFAGLVSDNFQAFFAPAGTPEPIIARLHASLRAWVAEPDTVAAMERQGFSIIADSPADFATALRAEQAVWAAVVRAGGIRAE
ncbi:Bug family tripartite tricarboxylate transporter substrate binding protein [Humitalea sp. 24SJ18S-53]|uniref:Bug family tripartite tricarboxylate transporter substrate binding protein n=1 Tax=Humitalea sp. 24SJ18S-53 TaxID=3422307 RepID=UPI003D670D6C